MAAPPLFVGERCEQRYRGRLAPSPTGFLHLGHAKTFWIAQERARAADGVLVLRNDDLDRDRCKAQFVSSMYEDLRWFGFGWQEGPDVGGPFGPYSQSERTSLYRAAFEALKAGGFLYPCTCSRQDVLRALGAPQAGEDEPIYPGTCRPRLPAPGERPDPARADAGEVVRRASWRFRVPPGQAVRFVDGGFGAQSFVAGQDFGDFVVWRHDDLPSYQLACVVDDARMQITEVVRGADLLRSTARQILLFRALGLAPPAFVHCPLVLDARGDRLAKRHDALSLRVFRAQGALPHELRLNW